MLADGFSAIADAIWTLLALGVLGAVVVSIAAAVVAARQDTAERRRPLAMVCGCLAGVTLAITTGWVLLYYADTFAGLLLGPVVGGAAAYGVASVMPSDMSRPAETGAADAAGKGQES
jgi:hypothetical protein